MTKEIELKRAKNKGLREMGGGGGGKRGDGLESVLSRQKGFSREGGIAKGLNVRAPCVRGVGR